MKNPSRVNNNKAENEFDEFSPSEIIDNLVKNKWIIIFFTLLAFIISFVYAYGQPSVYKANSLLRVESQKPTVPGLEDLMKLTASSEASVITEVELIKSTKILSETVKYLKLDIEAEPSKIWLISHFFHYFFSPDDVKKLPSIWKRFDNLVYPYAWGNEKISVVRFNVPKEFINASFKIIKGKNNYFDLVFNDKAILTGKVGESSISSDDKFSIFVSKLTGLEHTEYSVTKLSDRSARSKLINKISANEKGVDTGILSLSITGKDEGLIVRVLNKISSTYIEQNKSRSSEEASNALKFLKEQIKPVKKNVDRAEANLKEYRTKNKTADLQQETGSVLSEVVALDAELQKISLYREELIQKYTINHPKIKILVAQTERLLVRRNDIKRKISKLPKKQQKLLELERDIKVSNSIYIELLNKIQEFKIAKASTVGNVYIVNFAESEEKPIKPQKILTIAIGVIIGFLLGFFIVVFRQILQPVRKMVISPKLLEETMGIPVYATVPLSKNVELTGNFKSKHRKQKILLASKNMTDPAIESLRSLRTSLHFALHEAKNNIVMITGPSASIGKSFISSNFSAVIANTGQKVILIDADMRKGYLHKIFGLNQTAGLSEIISKQVKLEEAVTRVKINNNNIDIDIITSGGVPPNPSELLMHENFLKLLDYLSANYDLVLIDTPPVNVVTDPTIIASHAGVVFMVVYSNQHTMEEIEYAVGRLSQTGIETKGFIFNGFEVPKNSYGQVYGYGYGYGEK
jgi:tyrosine-protein kinase Etk/Wzc